jgi:hypothetical protein
MLTEVLQVQQRLRITAALHSAPATGKMSAKAAIAPVAPVAPLHLEWKTIVESALFGAVVYINQHLPTSPFRLSVTLHWLRPSSDASASADMPNQRQPGTKLAGAYIGAEKDKALAEIAALKGYANKAEFIRFLFDEAIAENEQALKKARSTGKPKM